MFLKNHLQSTDRKDRGAGVYPSVPSLSVHIWVPVLAPDSSLQLMLQTRRDKGKGSMTESSVSHLWELDWILSSRLQPSLTQCQLLQAFGWCKEWRNEPEACSLLCLSPPSFFSSLSPFLFLSSFLSSPSPFFSTPCKINFQNIKKIGVQKRNKKLIQRTSSI